MWSTKHAAVADKKYNYHLKAKDGLAFHMYLYNQLGLFYSACVTV
jgi:hypothetical protein